MSRQRRSATATDRTGRHLKGELRDALLEAGAERLKKLGKVLGNQALSGQVARADKLRDELLAFIHARLEAIHLAQQAERKLMRDRKSWYRRLAKGEKGLALPQPTRWAAPAQLYKKAGEAICAGELGRGADLLKQATESERTAFKSAPKNLPLPTGDRKGSANPTIAEGVRAGEGCTPTTAPEMERLADGIANVSDTMDEVPFDRRYKTHNWWEVVEDEADEKKGKEKGTGQPRASKRMREPAAEKDAVNAGRSPGVEVPSLVREVKVGVEPPVPEVEPVPEARAPKRRGAKPPGG